MRSVSGVILTRVDEVYSDELSHYKFVYTTFHSDCPGPEDGLPPKKSAA